MLFNGTKFLAPYIAIIDSTYLVIYDKLKSKRLIIWTISENREFYYKFCDYCLGIEPKEIDVPEEDFSENAVPTDEG